MKKLSSKQLEALLENSTSKTVLVAENENGNSLYLDILNDKLIAINRDEVNLACYPMAGMVSAIEFFNDYKNEHHYVVNAGLSTKKYDTELITYKAERAQEMRDKMAEAIETLKTTTTFINSINGHTAEKYIEMINMLNRFIKFSLTDTQSVLQHKDDETINLHRNASKNEAMELIHLLSK